MTTSSPPTLPTGPLPHLAMDYARLRAAGVELLGRLSGRQWTDFNTHDPGITILEQLCYAITDLGYRTNYPMADLLAGGVELGLPGPAQILTGDPVTSTDLRQLVLDVCSSDGSPAIANAWLEDAGAAGLDFYYHDHANGESELRLEVDESRVDARPVKLRGLHRVLLQPTEPTSHETALEQVAARIHQSRLLCEDFELKRLGQFPVSLTATIEIGAVEDPVAVLADIVEQIEACLAPPVRFITRAEALTRGLRTDELFQGPSLRRGYVDALPEPRRSIYVSDLVHAIMDVPVVRAVSKLELTGGERWSLAVSAGSVATLASGSTLTLLRGGLTVPADLFEARARIAERRRSRGLASNDSRELTPPMGRDRSLERHRSIRRQLPAAYGVGPLGLSRELPASRRAQARQLETYLLIFDQLLANAFAQLAHAHELLSPDPGSARTYFTRPFADPPLTVDELLLDPANHATWLNGHIEPGEPAQPIERRKRLLGHLLARFAEQVGEQGGFGTRESERAVLPARQAFLQQIARLSGARGSGYDLHAEPRTNSGLADRLRLKLGLPDGVRFHIVEHLLLRPLDEDNGQRRGEGEEQVPLLAGVAGPDPWSLRVSYVFQELEPANVDIERWVVQTIVTETPAHITAQLHWFSAPQRLAPSGANEGTDDFAAFESAWQDFRENYRAYQRAKLLEGGVPTAIQLRTRAARDRVIDLLGFGRTYPLRDVPFPAHLFVASGNSTSVTLEYSQPDVDYQLMDHETGAPVMPAVNGTGASLPLWTPPIRGDVSYRILAVKREAGGAPKAPREAWLRGAVRIDEGIDRTPVAELLGLPLLNPVINSAKPSDARLSHYGHEVEVALLGSQEGVIYELLDHADLTRVLSAPVVGIGTGGATGGTIVLALGPAKEDLDLRVRGRRAVGNPQNPDQDSAVLDAVLSLRVRANPDLGAELDPAIVSYGGSSKLRLGRPQPGVSYRVWQRPIRDSEFASDDALPFATVGVPGDRGRTVRVWRPERAPIWRDLPGLTPLGKAQTSGGAALEFPLGSFERDVFLLVEAAKRHHTGWVGSNSDLIRSATQLEPALALLVRPNPQQLIRLQVTVADGTTQGPLRVFDGQPGVYYELWPEAAKPIARSAYFHQRDDVDATFNKGLEQLRVEVDLTITRDRPSHAALNRATTPPLDPELDSEPLPLGSVLHALARKAMSGLEASLEGTAILHPVPVLRVEPESVMMGESASIVLETSVLGERYTLLLEGAIVGETRVGDGGRLELTTDVLKEPGVFRFVVAIERNMATALPVQRRVEIKVKVNG